MLFFLVISFLNPLILPDMSQDKREKLPNISFSFQVLKTRYAVITIVALGPLFETVEI